MQLYRKRCKTAHRDLQGRFLRFAPFYHSRYQTDKSGYNAIFATLERITAPGRHPHIPDTAVTPGRCTGQHSRPIIIMYIRVRPCYGSMPDGATYRIPCQPLGISSCRVWIVGKCWHTTSSTDPEHLLRDQRLHLYTVSPAAVSMLPAPGGWMPGTGSSVRAHRLAPFTRRGSPAARSAAGGAEPLAALAAALFGLSPDS